MKVRLTMTVEVDPENWELNYGIDAKDRKALREDVERYCFGCVSDSQAAVQGSITNVN